MILYILVALIPLILGSLYVEKSELSLEDVKRNRRRRFRWLLLASLPMFFLIAFRHQYLGADTVVYINHFTDMTTTPWDNIFDNTRMEHGYIIFVKAITHFTSEPLVYQVICALIYWLSISFFANQLDDSPFLFLFFFCTLGTYTFMFTGTRQCLAMCICLISYVFVKKQKLLPFLLCILLAYYFHKSSLLFLAAYLIFPRKINVLNTVIISVLCGISITYLDVIQDWFNEQLDYDYEIESTTSGSIYLAFLILLTLLTVFLIFNNRQNFNKNVKGVFNIGFIAVFFWVLRLSTRVAERPSYYFLFFSFAALASAIEGIKNRSDHAIVKTGIIGLCLILYVYRFMTNFNSLVPYHFYAF